MVHCTASLDGTGLLSSFWKHSLESCFTSESLEAMDKKKNKGSMNQVDFCSRFVYKSDLTRL